MFSRKEDLIRKTGEDGIGRLQFLEMLVKEFNETKSYESRKQVLANLANFAYDPINYEYFRRLQIITLFLETISSSTDETLIHFALAGLCNLCLDPKNKQIIIRYDGARYISALLSSKHEEILLNTLTTLMFLITPDTKDQIISKQLQSSLNILKTSENPRFSNLANIFLIDHFVS